jgi:VanZ family protein
LTIKKILSAWLPVAVWLVVIAIESTESLGASHTFGMMWRVAQALHLPFSMDQLTEINHILRKCGHFLGYGTLGVLFVRAWMMTMTLTKRTRSAPDVRDSRESKKRPLLATAIALGLFCTFCVASADEFHQLFLPGRTGAAHDVALDMTGAAVLAGIAVPAIRRTREQ